VLSPCSQVSVLNIGENSVAFNRRKAKTGAKSDGDAPICVRALTPAASLPRAQHPRGPRGQRAPGEGEPRQQAGQRSARHHSDSIGGP